MVRGGVGIPTGGADVCEHREVPTLTELPARVTAGIYAARLLHAPEDRRFQRRPYSTRSLFPHSCLGRPGLQQQQQQLCLNFSIVPGRRVSLVFLEFFSLAQTFQQPRVLRSSL